MALNDVSEVVLGGVEERPLTTKLVVVRYKTDHGMAEKKFTVYRTHHGPIIAQEGDKWISIRLMQKPIEALT